MEAGGLQLGGVPAIVCRVVEVEHDVDLVVHGPFQVARHHPILGIDHEAPHVVSDHGWPRLSYATSARVPSRCRYSWVVTFFLGAEHDSSVGVDERVSLSRIERHEGVLNGRQNPLQQLLALIYLCDRGMSKQPMGVVATVHTSSTSK